MRIFTLHLAQSAHWAPVPHDKCLTHDFVAPCARRLSVQVSTPSAGVGYKIAFMVYQRCKPCLCLFNTGGEASSGLPAVIRGDRMLDVRTNFASLSPVPVLALFIGSPLLIIFCTVLIGTHNFEAQATYPQRDKYMYAENPTQGNRQANPFGEFTVPNILSPFLHWFLSRCTTTRKLQRSLASLTTGSRSGSPPGGAMTRARGAVVGSAGAGTLRVTVVSHRTARGQYSRSPTLRPGPTLHPVSAKEW